MSKSKKPCQYCARENRHRQGHSAAAGAGLVFLECRFDDRSYIKSITGSSGSAHPVYAENP